MRTLSLVLLAGVFGTGAMTWSEMQPHPIESKSLDLAFSKVSGAVSVHTRRALVGAALEPVVVATVDLVGRPQSPRGEEVAVVVAHTLLEQVPEAKGAAEIRVEIRIPRGGAAGASADGWTFEHRATPTEWRGRLASR
ncbi:MAG TPA: hypothetical protein PLA94_14245 [Myxococcota bacterium]|nr:hypothetical protein [Myxococcota bacterium]